MGAKRSLELDDLFRLRLPSDPQISSRGDVAFVVTQALQETDDYSHTIWISAGGQTAKQFTQGKNDSSPRWSPDGAILGFLRPGENEKPQISVIPPDGGEARRITSGENGVAEFTWHPSGDRILYTATVTRETGDSAPEDDDPDAKEDEPKPLEIHRAIFKADGRGLLGDKRRHLFVVPVDGGEPAQLTSGDFDVTSPSVSPDGSRVAFTTAKHDDRDLDYVSHVFSIDIDGGELVQLTEWNGNATVPSWSPDGSSIVFAGKATPRSDRHSKLFEVAAEGGEPREVAPGFDRNVMIGVAGYPGAPPKFEAGGSSILFAARDRGCTNAYTVSSNGGEPVKIVGDGDTVVTGLSLNADGRIAYAAASATAPGDVFLQQSSGGTKALTSLNEELLDEIEVPAPERRSFLAPDGREIEGWVLFGEGHATRRPLLLDVHGGPHNAFSPAFSSSSLYRFILAAKGWNILFINSRGSDGYGEDFYGGLTGGWGRNDADDYLTAVETLIDEGHADPDRLAVTGYSYGGYMTSWLLSTSDKFAAGITGGCVTNLTSQYGTSDFGAFLHWEMGGEAHEMHELYWELSPLAHVESVTAPVLILHGLSDDRCPVGQAEEWFTALKRQRKVVEMVLYPDSSHLFVLNGKPSFRIDYANRIVEWVGMHASAKDAGERESS